jgi:hypothetical protein
MFVFIKFKKCYHPVHFQTAEDQTTQDKDFPACFVLI